MKYHFVTSILFAVSVSLMAIIDNMRTRLYFLLPSLIFFYATIILFGVEYDSTKIDLWKKKEQNVLKDAYLKFVCDYHSKKKEKSN